MRVLILGADGFVGRGIVAEAAMQHEVFASTRKKDNYNVDLTNSVAVEELLRKTNPEVVVSAAGIVENSERATLNVTFTRNVLNGILKLDTRPRFVICSSAALYGHVSEEDLPVSETVPVNPVGYYANAKKDEEDLALQIGAENGFSVISARLFNPIGPGMHERFLISNILRQIDEIKGGMRSHIELSRLDSKRDYIDLRDIAKAMVSLFEVKQDGENIYNVGSGHATENRTILRLLLAAEGLPLDTPTVETSNSPEQTVACQADIDRIYRATGWTPSYTLEETIQGVIDANR